VFCSQELLRTSSLELAIPTDAALGGPVLVRLAASRQAIAKPAINRTRPNFMNRLSLEKFD